MSTMLRRLFLLAVLAGAGYAAWSAWRRKSEAPSQPAPEWPPLEAPSGSTAGAAAVTSLTSMDRARATAAPNAAAATSSGTAIDSGGPPKSAWVESVDGTCPLSHPIKANDNSGIYHLPGGRFYDRTGAERCYARADDAEADGYRAAKS